MQIGDEEYRAAIPVYVTFIVKMNSIVRNRKGRSKMQKGRIISALTLCFAILAAGTGVARKPEKPGKQPALISATFDGDMTGSGQVYDNFYQKPSYTPFAMTLSGRLPAGTYDGTLMLGAAGNRGRVKLVRAKFHNDEVSVHCVYGEWDRKANPNLIDFTNQEAYINGDDVPVPVSFIILLGNK